MTLRELLNSEVIHLAYQETKVYFMKYHGSESYILKFDNNVTINNALRSFNSQTLDSEISLIEFMNDALIVYFKEQ